ncbi:hypothetical protein EYF80_036020 [Liparis tanakae]|uniref:Uncharacterized protein n=1 Tax=Liparis tanakae TaxID=230148 RepID=A0A4Z2GLT9_9TELE|nr:hypothetical protein EYF80_036020 [Liparis tanakae]
MAVAETSRCCGEAAKQIMSRPDYLRGPITAERLIWVRSKLVLQGSAVATAVLLMGGGLICPREHLHSESPAGGGASGSPLTGPPDARTKMVTRRVSCSEAPPRFVIAAVSRVFW